MSSGRVATTASRHETSLRAKLTMVMFGLAVIILLCAAGGFAFRTWQILKSSLVRQVFTIAETIGSSSSAAVLFKNREDATELLGVLDSQPNIESAFLFDASGAMLAQYVRPGHELAVPLTLPKQTSYSFEDASLTVFYKIPFKGEEIGALQIRSETAPLYDTVREQLGVLAALLAGCLVGAGVLSLLLQRFLMRPIADLARAAGEIASGERRGVRAQRLTDDELGTLADTFNLMMDTLERREDELRGEVTQRRSAEAALEVRKEELEALNAKLALSNRELDEFAYVASHDLQEPLRKIQTFADLLTRKAGSVLDQQSKEYVGHLVDCATRMRTLIEDLLQLSRVVSKGRVIESVDLNQILSKVISDLSVPIAESDAVVQVGPLPTLEGDPTQLYSLFLNLVGNAIKYRSKGIAPIVSVEGGISQDSTSSPRSVTLIIRDNGIGFDRKHAERIFRPFQRLHGRAEYAGTGIGLALCAKIVERHSGCITADAEPERGATFTVVLPELQAGDFAYDPNPPHTDSALG